MNMEEMKLHRLSGQHLLRPVKARQAAENLCGLQAQFLRNAVYALRIRSEELSLTGLVKTWTLRGTVHLIPEEDLPLYLRTCGTAEDVCESGWYRWVSGRGHANPPEREREIARLMTAGIAAGIDTRDGLRTYLAAQGITDAEEARVFDPWGGMLRELAEMGVIGFCTAMQDDVHPDETKRYRLLPPFTPISEEAAKLELARRYLSHCGPVTLRDAAYFFHWTQAEARAVFERLPTETFVCENRIYWHIPTEAPEKETPEVILLAGFDPLMLSYRKEDSPFLPPEHLRGIFNLAGIVNPAILLHGRVVGKWKESKGKVELTAFEHICDHDRKAVEREAERLFHIRKLKWL